MKKPALTVIVIATVAATSAFAQAGAGGGMGQGGKMRFAWNQDYVRGWALMTRDERTVWQINMREAKTYDECKALLDAHHRIVEARATEMGVVLIEPRYDTCAVLKARGFLE